MGVYDNLGNYQVKAFKKVGKPLYFESEDINDVEYEPYISNGSLEYYAKGDAVPWRTLYYNYGKDFEIFDFRLVTMSADAILHVFRDGKYYKSYKYPRIPNDFVPALVLDYYGEPLLIKTRGNLLSIVLESIETDKKCKELYQKYLEESNSFEIPPSEFCKYSTEELKANFDIVNAARKRAANETYDPFEDKWYASKDSDLYKSIYGGLDFGSFLYVMLENNQMQEFEKYKTTQMFLEQLKKDGKNLDEVIKEYFVWSPNIVSRTSVEIIFDKYTQEIPEDVKKSFIESTPWNLHLKLMAAQKGGRVL